MKTLKKIANACKTLQSLLNDLAIVYVVSKTYYSCQLTA